MVDEIIVKVRADVDGFKADMDEAKKIGNSAISELEKKDAFGKTTLGAAALNKELGGLNSTGKETTSTFGEMFKSFSASALVVSAISGISALLGGMSAKIVEVTAKYQKFEAVLTNTLGSKSEAQKAMKQILDFAAKTPFQVDELTDSFVKFANRGIKITIAEMTKWGDIARSHGKSFDEITEAVLDAQTGEFERLKEFGIRASKEGDKVTLSFKGVTKEVANNEQAIKNAIVSYGELNGVAGGMEAISKTLGGSLSNMADSFDKLFAAIGSNIGEGLTSIINGFTNAINKLSEFIAVKEDAVTTGINATFQNKAEADSAQKLLNEYESLKNKGVNATANEKKRMTDITYQLKDSLGESVVAINRETGALEVNIEATKQAIKQKILLSNTELAKVALEFNNAKAQEKAANDELKRINDSRKSKNDALLNDEKNFSKRRTLLEQEGQSDFLALKPLRTAASEQSKILLKSRETIKTTKDELAKFGFNVEDFDFDELAKSALDTKEKSDTAIGKVDDKTKENEKKRALKVKKDLEKAKNEAEFKAAQERQKVLDEIENANYKNEFERERQQIRDEFFLKIESNKELEAELIKLREVRIAEVNKKEIEANKNIAEQQKKNIASVNIALGDAAQRGFETREEYEKRLFEEQKKNLKDILTFAQNGILLQIGINPQDVERVKSGILNAMDVIKANQKVLDDVSATAKEQSQARLENLQAISQTVASGITTISNSIFAADTQRRQEELAALQVQQKVSDLKLNFKTSSTYNNFSLL